MDRWKTRGKWFVPLLLMVWGVTTATAQVPSYSAAGGLANDGRVASAAYSELLGAEFPGGEPIPTPAEAVAGPPPEALPPEGMFAVPNLPAMPVLLEPPELPPGAPSWYSVDWWVGPIPWDKSIEVGINGTQGTNDAFSLRAGGGLFRKTDWNKVDVDFAYNKASANDVETQNNAQFEGRHDWLLGESPWTIFAANSLLYDEFQAFDLRFAINSGFGYQFIETDATNLIGRIGAGTSREFGGPDESWVPEALFGLEFDHRINKVQSLTAKIDYFPDWGDFTSYRVVTDVGWELLVDAETNMSLKLSVNDRYDSTPNGAEANLLNYSILLLWKL